MIKVQHFLISTYLIKVIYVVYFGNLGPFDDTMREMGPLDDANDKQDPLIT